MSSANIHSLLFYGEMSMIEDIGEKVVNMPESPVFKFFVF